MKFITAVGTAAIIMISGATLLAAKMTAMKLIMLITIEMTVFVWLIICIGRMPASRFAFSRLE